MIFDSVLLPWIVKKFEYPGSIFLNSSCQRYWHVQILDFFLWQISALLMPWEPIRTARTDWLLWPAELMSWDIMCYTCPWVGVSHVENYFFSRWHADCKKKKKRFDIIISIKYAIHICFTSGLFQIQSLRATVLHVLDICLPQHTLFKLMLHHQLVIKVSARL